MDTFDPEAAADPIPRPAAAASTTRPSGRPARRWARRSGSSGTGRAALEVSELFRAARRPARRRSLRDPLDAHRHADPRELAAPDELRRQHDAPGPASGSWITYGLGTRKPEPARLHRARAQRHAGRRRGQLADVVSPGDLSGHLHRNAATDEPQRRSSSICSNPQLAADEQRAQLDLARSSSTPASRHSGTTSRAGGAHPVVRTAFRMQTEATDAFDIDREPEHIRTLYGDSAAGAADARSRGGSSSAACASCRSGTARCSRGTATTTSKPSHRKLAREC